MEQLLNFCDYCFHKNALIILEIFKSEDNLYQRVEVKGYEFEKEYIIFQTTSQEEYLVMLENLTLHTRSKINDGTYQYDDFPREKRWGLNIIFEIIDNLHDHDVVFAIGTEDDTLIKDYLRNNPI